MLRFLLLLTSILLLTSCHYMKQQAEQAKQEDTSKCIAAGYAQGSELFDKCMNALEDQRAQRDIRRVREDLDEYDRLKQDRTNQHLMNPGF